jgi:hypothetical protein
LRIKTAIEKKACNALLLKVCCDFMGTLTELTTLGRSTRSVLSPSPSKRKPSLHSLKRLTDNELAFSYLSRTAGVS